MKQKRFGQKVQNWHRPFQPSAFSQRYLRLRQQAEIVDYQYDGFDWDDWNDSQCWCDCCDPREEPYLDFRLNKLFSYITTPLNPLLNLHEMEIGQTEASGYAISPKPTETGSLEQRLAEHVKSFLGSWEDEAICRQITEYVGDRQNLSVLTRVAEINEIPGVVKLICFFAPFWVRQPMTWRQESGVSLLDHIFVLYDTPDFLFAEWRKQANAKVPDIKWLCWFILFAQGGSLKRAAALFNWNIADGFQHHLWKMPFGISAKEACLLAEVRRMGGNETDFWRICSYEPFAIDPTTFADQTNHAEAFWEERVTIDGNFWSQTVRWLIANRDEMEDESVILILSWAMHEYTETQRFHLRK